MCHTTFFFIFSSSLRQLIACERAGLLEEEVDKEDNAATVKAKMFYRSCMNTSKYYPIENQVQFDEMLFKSSDEVTFTVLMEQALRVYLLPTSNNKRNSN